MLASDDIVLLPATWREVPAGARRFRVMRRTTTTAVIQDGVTMHVVGTVTGVGGRTRTFTATDDLADAWSQAVAATAAVRCCSDVAVAEQYLLAALLDEQELRRELRRTSGICHRHVCLDAADAEAWVQAGSPFAVAAPPTHDIELLTAGREVWTGSRWYAGVPFTAAAA
jgi:hypothetical protein